MKTKKGMDIGGGISYMIAIFVLLILAFTWFFPTLNGASGLNNVSTLFIGGTNYSWVIPLMAVVICITLVVMVLRKGGLMGGK